LAAGAVAGFGAAAAAGFAAVAAGLGAAASVAGATGFGGVGLGAITVAASAGAVGSPVAELVSLVVAVCAAAGFSGFGADGSVRGSAGAVADTPAPGASVRDTSAFSGSPGVSPAGLSPAAVGGVSGVFGSSAMRH
jgi:hypothetical protein